jgi:hypothetical protein
MTVTPCTSQPSRSIMTLTMQLIGLFSSSTWHRALLVQAQFEKAEI